MTLWGSCDTKTSLIDLLSKKAVPLEVNADIIRPITTGKNEANSLCRIFPCKQVIQNKNINVTYRKARKCSNADIELRHDISNVYIAVQKQGQYPYGVYGFGIQ